MFAIFWFVAAGASVFHKHISSWYCKGRHFVMDKWVYSLQNYKRERKLYMSFISLNMQITDVADLIRYNKILYRTLWRSLVWNSTIFGNTMLILLLHSKIYNYWHLWSVVQVYCPKGRNNRRTNNRRVCRNVLSRQSWFIGTFGKLSITRVYT